MKLIQKLMPLMILMIVSLKSFSQTDTDTTSIQLQKPIAKLVIKDLITGDGAKEELVHTVDKLQLLEQKIVLKDSIITNLNGQISNFNSIIGTKSDQLSLSKELSERLKKDLKKQKLKTKLVGGAGILVAVGVAILVN
tara:strand:- start:622 stop:1035 length:414 start_codon:yes stop_codon:yes gene_type:complete